MRPTRLACAALLAFTAACAGESDTFQLKLGHDQTDGHPYDLAVKRFAAAVDSATAGAVHIQVFPAAQLGDSPEQIEGLYLGALDFALAAFSHASQFCSELGIFGAPFLFESEDHFARVFDGPIGEELSDACSEDYGIRLLSTFTSGYRVLFNGKRPIESAGDLTGLKIRVMGGEADAETWQAFGAIPQPMPYSEVYSALQAGVIDGAENEPASILANKFYETAHYFARTRHLVLPMGLFVSEKTLARLPEEYRDIIRAQAREAAVWERDFMVQRNEAALDSMRTTYGAVISSIDASTLRARGIAIQDEVAARLGLQDLLARIRDSAR